MLKKILKFFEYFFECSSRFATTLIIIALTILFIHSYGWYSLALLLGDMLLLGFGAVLLTTIGAIIWICLKIAWYGDELDLEKYNIELMPYMVYISFFILLVFYVLDPTTRYLLK